MSMIVIEKCRVGAKLEWVLIVVLSKGNWQFRMKICICLVEIN